MENDYSHSCEKKNNFSFNGIILFISNFITHKKTRRNKDKLYYIIRNSFVKIIYRALTFTFYSFLYKGTL